jgi:hypothetical protein
MSRIYKKYIDNCVECPHYSWGWCGDLSKKLSHAIAKMQVDRECKLEREKRSKPQNNYYWGVVIDILSKEWGYTKEETHDLLKVQFLTEKNIGKPDRIRSTTSLDTKEAEDYYFAIRQWAITEWGINIPEPNELENERT